MFPILLEIPTPWGRVPVFSYGVMLGASLAIAWYIILRLGKTKEGLSHEIISNAFLIAAASGIVGARVLYIATNIDSFYAPAQWFALRSGGMVAYGGFIGGFIGSWVYMHMRRLPILAWADVVAPTLASGLFFTRIGCYLYGCDYGARLSSKAPAWLRTLGRFPRWRFGADGNLACSDSVEGAPAWSHHRQAYGLATDATHSFPVHPTQLYEAAAGLILFALCMWVWSRRRFRGQVLLSLVMAYGAWRFLIEFVRDDPERGYLLGLSTSQLISVALIPLAAFFYVRERGRAPRTLTPLRVSTRSTSIKPNPTKRRRKRK